MATQPPFPQAGFLSQLEHASASASLLAGTGLSPLLARLLLAADGSGAWTEAAADLIPLLKAHQGILQASFDTALSADELRRYQKFARPGQPSPHIVQLRQKQAAARQASSLARQSFNKAAAAFVRTAGIHVPERIALETYISHWIETNVPKGVDPSA
ncbi:hypothetical protein [Dyella silvatica]|uniref:hypothetical protein n=1 Tax=Dyella silvatica TaxID=2992128 RepID=UPI00225AE707|nr:hypothetical protein [Dyella silvatica]